MLGGLVSAVILLFHGPLPTEFFESIGFSLAVGVAFVLLSVVVARSLMMGDWRRFRRSRDSLREHLDTHMALGGSHILISISSEDAQKQWPEIKRRLDAWEAGLDDTEESNTGTQ